MSKGYTDEQKQWILHSASQSWKNVREFSEAFNRQFSLNKSYDSFRAYLHNNSIIVNADSINEAYTQEQIEWINENVNIGIFKNQAHFTKIFNIVFGTNKNADAMAVYLRKRGISISTERTEKRFTDKQKQWISDNCNWTIYHSFNDFVKAFNAEFSIHTTRSQLFNYCYRKGIYEKGDLPHHAQFKKGEKSSFSRDECPIGTIHSVKGRPYIKVQMCNGKANVVGKGKDNHGLNEPYWKPLQKKIWEDNYGKVPDGYEVCSLNGDKYDTNIEHIGLIDKRMKGTMALKGWWTENAKLTSTAVQWCNLYMTAKDNNII